MLPIEQAIAWIEKCTPKHVALQFSDDLLCHAADIANRLKNLAKIYVLGDTTFGSCCVDTVAAAHVQCDMLIHFGPACLSEPSCSYPVVYVSHRNLQKIFEEKEVDISALANSFERFASGNFVLVLYDVSYHHCINSLKEKLENNALSSFLIWSELKKTHNVNNDFEDGFEEFHGRRFKLPVGVEVEKLNVFFIGPSSLLLTHITMEYVRSPQILYMDPAIHKEPQEAIIANKLFMRRYAMIQKAKDAIVIGIVVGTLGVGKLFFHFYCNCK